MNDILKRVGSFFGNMPTPNRTVPESLVFAVEAIRAVVLYKFPGGGDIPCIAFSLPGVIDQDATDDARTFPLETLTWNGERLECVVIVSRKRSEGWATALVRMRNKRTSEDWKFGVELTSVRALVVRELSR